MDDGGEIDSSFGESGAGFSKLGEIAMQGNKIICSIDRDPSDFALARIKLDGTDCQVSAQDEPPADLAPHVSPNPAFGFVEISLLDNPVTQVTAFDLNGKPTAWAVGQTPIRLDVSGWPAGVYFLQIETSKGRCVRRLVKL